MTNRTAALTLRQALGLQSQSGLEFGRLEAFPETDEQGDATITETAYTTHPPKDSNVG